MSEDPDRYELSMRGPPPGTPGVCCPEQLIKDGQCKSCTHVFDEVLALLTKEAHWLARVDPNSSSHYKGVCLNCAGTHIHEVLIYENGYLTEKVAKKVPCPGCVRCCETCDWVAMHDDELTGHCVRHDVEVSYDECCRNFEPQDV